MAFYVVIADGTTGTLTTTRATNYYNFLTDALLHGEVSLLVKPRSELLALHDPYDPTANRAYRLHDMSLYRGKYYLYWGLSPVILAYVPVRVLAGTYLTDATACIAFAALGLLLYAALVLAIREDYFPRSSSWTLIPLIFLLAFGTMLPFVLRRHLVYEVAISCGYFLTAAFFLAIYRGAFRGALHRGWILASSVALGLVLLCRVNLTIAIVTTIVACCLYARRNRSGIARGQLLGLAFGPLALCTAVQALYDWARFGSISEFGLRYQLSIVNMRHYTFVSATRGLSSALYIFLNLPVFTTHLPFVMARSHGLIRPLRAAAAALQPYTPDFHVEPIIGIVIAVPLLLTLVIAPRIRSRDPQSDLRWFFRSILAATAIQIAFVCSVLAPITRYEVDFMPLLLVAVAIVILQIDQAMKPRWASISLRTGFVALTLYTVFVSAAMSLTDFVDVGPHVS